MSRFDGSSGTMRCSFTVVVYYLFFIGSIAGGFALAALEQQGSVDGPKASSERWIRERRDDSTFSYDVVIYGSTPAALTAAVQIHDMGHTVAIVSPEEHIGGLTSSGLGWTDSKDSNAIGGIARDFYQEVYTHYSDESAWTFGSRQKYLDLNLRAQPGMAIEADKEVQWTFEPHVAEEIFERWMSDRDIPIYRGEYVSRSGSGVSLTDAKINSFKTESGKTFAAKQFIDAGYEGDLMASAGIGYVIGRDSHDLYKESLAGTRLDTENNSGADKSKAYDGVDPFKVKGNAKSGLLYGIEISYDTLPSGFDGTSDSLRLQSYMYRLCLTKEKDNKVAFSKPKNYNESNYELLLRYHEAGHSGGFSTQMMPNSKTDSNNDGEVSFDFLGGNYNLQSDPPISYSSASYDQRKDFVQAHMDWQQGLLWTLTHHERIPAKTREELSEWGLAKDEFTSNSNWPYQLYIREARRMQGDFTLTQQDIQNTNGYLGGAVAGLGSYSMDSHAIRRVVLDGKIYDEGWFYETLPKPYVIPLSVMFPKKSEATNFINPVTISASHVAFGSVRMEPTYMILGQSAGIAAVMAIEKNKAVQDINQKCFMKKMSKYKQQTTI